MAQAYIDTTYSLNKDTVLIKKHKQDNTLSTEWFYVNDELIWSRDWYKLKDSGYGYFQYNTIEYNETGLYIQEEFYPNGTSKVYSTKIKRKKTGKFITRFENGNIQCNCQYLNGKRNGIQKMYYKNGTLELEANYHNNNENGTFNYFHDNGKPWSKTIYKNGRLIEVLNNFDRNGVEREKGSFKNGKGTVFIYNYKGKLKSIEIYKNGKRRRTKKIK